MSKRTQYERDRRERLKAEGQEILHIWVRPENKTLLQSLQGDMRQKKIERIVFEGEWWNY